MRKRFVILFVVLVVSIWVAVDLFRPVRSNFRSFDPLAVAKLETDMWRSYYERRPLRLFLQLSSLLRSQYGLPFLRSNLVSYYATRAAFVFKKGHGRSDYEKALPHLVRYFQAIRKASDSSFDVDRAARVELEWWIIHRERKKQDRAKLDRSISEIQEVLYALPAEKFQEHAHHRAEAMLLRDNLADGKGVADADWKRINSMLDMSWRSLKSSVNE